VVSAIAVPARGAEPPEGEPRPGPAPTDLERARGLRVARVAVAGNRRVAADELAEHVVHLRPGETFTPEGLASDVRDLWASGLVEDVEVDLTVGDDGVRLRVLVRERPTLEAVELSGNAAVSADDLREAMGSELAPGAVPDHGAAGRAVQKLRDKYAEEGFYLAEVREELVPRKGNRITVRFKIKEHERLSVQRVTFVGNVHVPEDDLREAMLTGKGGIWAFLGGTGGPFRQDVFERDILVMNALYYDRGYLSAEIGTPRVMVNAERTGIEVTIPITEGPRYRIRSLRLIETDEDGREIEPLGGRRHLREMVRAQPGDYFNRAELVHDLAAVQAMYRDAGYASVEAPPTTNLDPEKEQVDIAVAVRRHRVVRFGRVEIRGNTKTRDKVIRRELEIRESEPFSETGLARSRQRVMALGYFERVDITTEQGADPEHLDVKVEIGERPTGTFQVGAGFSSLESFLLNAQVQQQNLFGRGQSLSVNAQISGLRQLVDLRFVEPYLFDTRLSASVNVENQLRAYDQFTQTSRGGSVTLGYPLLWPSLRGSLTYTLQEDRIAGSGAPATLGTSTATSVFQDLPLANLFSQGKTSSLRATLAYDTRDNVITPSSGVFLQGSAEMASRLWGSDNEFIRWQATGRFYYPLSADGSFVLKLNTEAGLVTSPSGHGVPIFSRYFLGGILDVRGFPLRSIGPRLPLRVHLDENSAPIPEGANIGGNLMVYQNLELEFPILKDLGIRGVVFADVGNAWNLERLYCNAAPFGHGGPTSPCFSPASLANLRASWGFGIRWRSPMGPLRFEWGLPFKPLPYEQPMLFEFTIGNSF
jgi:outer membrane protein insertion porin family